MKTVVENCWDNVAEWSFFLVPSDELVVVKNNACVAQGKFQSCQGRCGTPLKPTRRVNLDDDGNEFIRHGQLRPTLRKACEQWISSIGGCGMPPLEIVVEFK